MTFSDYKPLSDEDLDLEQEKPQYSVREQSRRPSGKILICLVVFLFTSLSFNAGFLYRQLQSQPKRIAESPSKYGKILYPPS